MCLEARDLECVRGDRRLFAELGFAVAAGEVVQVEGANGAGKTSLLRILCGLLRPAAGAVYWCGNDIRAEPAAFRRATAYIGHAAGVKEPLTPLENLRVTWGTAPRRAGAAPEAALDRVGLGGFQDLPVRTLSAGQRRRAALARLLLTGARLWLLDEPFTALDRGGCELVETMLAEHVRGGGMAVLTSHRPVAIDDCEVRRLTLG